MSDDSLLGARFGLGHSTGSGSASNPVDDGVNAARRELELLYVSHFGKVFGYFRRSGVPEALAMELAQDTFRHALHGLPQFRGHSKLSTWLWAIARNVFLVHRRSMPAVETDQDNPVDPDTLTAGEAADLSDSRDCVRRGFEAFSRVHPERAQVVFLAVVEGWTRSELAEFLGRSEHAATEYLSQCKARLRPYIEPCRDN